MGLLWSSRLGLGSQAYQHGIGCGAPVLNNLPDLGNVMALRHARFKSAMLWMLFYPPVIKHGNGKSIENPSLISRLLSHSNILKHIKTTFTDYISSFSMSDFQQDVFSYRWTSKYFPPRGLKTLEDAGPHNSNLEVAVGSLHAVLAGRLGLKSTTLW